MKEPKLRGRAWIALWVLSVLVFSLAVTSIHAQSTRKFTEWAIPTSSNCPFDVLPISRNVIYFAESGCNSNAGQIGRVNAETNTITEWSGSAIVGPQRLIALGGSILFTDAGTNTIDLFNPKTNALTKWAVPFSGPLKLVAVETNIFFTELNGDKIGMLNLLTNKLTEWAVPGPAGGPLGIDASDDGSRIFFSKLSAPQLGALNPDDNTFEQWTLPSATSGHHVQNVALADEDSLFFVDDSTGTVGQLDSDTNSITLWSTPTGGGPVDLQVRDTENDSEGEGFRVDFTESSVNRIASLLTAFQIGTNVTVLPVVTAVTPTVTLVTPTTASLTPSSTVVTPTITSVAGIITGGFEEWTVPTANSDVYAIVERPGGGVAFSEANGNKIGTLR